MLESAKNTEGTTCIGQNSEHMGISAVIDFWDDRPEVIVCGLGVSPHAANRTQLCRQH